MLGLPQLFYGQFAHIFASPVARDNLFGLIQLCWASEKVERVGGGEEVLGSTPII